MPHEPTTRQANRVWRLVQASANAPWEELRRVQEAIAADVRQRLAGLDGVSLVSDTADVCLQTGAGALLTESGWLALREQCTEPLSLPLPGLSPQEGPTPTRSAGLCFVVREPADLHILALHPDTGPQTRAALADLGLDLSRWNRLLPAFTNRDAEIAVLGRLWPPAWRFLEDQVACRVRVYADGGPADGGMAATLFRMLSDEAFVDMLREWGQGAIVDSRQLLVGDSEPTPADWYHADLGRPQAVRHAGLRRLAELAGGADLPILLGGESLLNGGLYALVETAWRTGKDFDRGYHVAW